MIGTHSRLMCHELRPHVNFWLMLTNPYELAMQEELKSSDTDSGLKSKTTANEVPLLLRDPIASLLLVLVNLPTNIQKSEKEFVQLKSSQIS